MNNKHKRYKLHRTVIIEKYSKKHYIKSANEYLMRLGVMLFFETKSEFSYGKQQKTYVNLQKDYTNEVINIYGVHNLHDVFHTFATNKKLKKLRHKPILPGQTPEIQGRIKDTDIHHNKYLFGILDKNNVSRMLLLRFNTVRAANQAGFECETAW